MVLAFNKKSDGVFRESYFTKQSPRLYKEDFYTRKNISQLKGQDNVTHYAEPPVRPANADAKCEAKMLKSNFDMYPKQRDGDTFSAPAKRTAQG